MEEKKTKNSINVWLNLIATLSVIVTYALFVYYLVIYKSEIFFSLNPAIQLCVGMTFVVIAAKVAGVKWI